jgi:hypothetical protein
MAEIGTRSALSDGTLEHRGVSFGMYRHFGPDIFELSEYSGRSFLNVMTFRVGPFLT